MYDIAIIGAGVAGASLAKMLGNKYKVLILDKRTIESDYIVGKCCGGLLAPDAQRMLAKLGMVVPQDIFVGPQLFAVKVIDIDNDLERMYQRFYLNLDRGRFDTWLLSLIPDGVDIQLGAVLKGIEEADGFSRVSYSLKGELHSIEARVIVGADGANSRVRSLLLPEGQQPKEYIAVQEWYEAPMDMPYYTAIFDKSISDFYSWTIPKEGHILLGSALIPKDDPNRKFQLLREKLVQRGLKFGERIKSESAFINRPLRSDQLFLGNGNAILIGEAAGAISPSSAEGISYALRTAFMAAQSLEKDISGSCRRYNAKAMQIKSNIALKNLKSPAMYNTFLRNIVMRSGIQSI